MPRVSIIIPAFNAQQTIAQTLDSLLAQTETDWEAYVIDDGSTDATPMIVRRYCKSDQRIVLATNPGKGPSDARNHGAKHLARAEIVAFCDADDLWVDTKLADVLAAFGKPATDAVFGRIAFFAKCPGNARTFSTVPSGALGIPTLMGENPVCTMSNLSVRRSLFLASGGFDPAMVHNEDLEWLIRLIGGGARIKGVDRLHIYYRTSPTGLSADISAMQDGRTRALATARRFGFDVDRAAEAVHCRYLARRALRLNLGGLTALKLALTGLLHSPSGFLTPVRRGAPTAVASVLSPLLPSPLRRALFAN